MCHSMTRPNRLRLSTTNHNMYNVNKTTDDDEKDDDKIVDEMRRAPVISKFSSFSFMFYFPNMYLQAIYMTTTTK